MKIEDFNGENVPKLVPDWEPRRDPRLSGQHGKPIEQLEPLPDCSDFNDVAPNENKEKPLTLKQRAFNFWPFKLG